jgi:hypothetical protein
MVTHPTFVVGVGQAGINVMNVLHEVAEQNDETDRFAFAAIDTDGDTLNNAPPEARRFALSIEDDFLRQDRARYPYLTRAMNIEGKGAKRQRPVGRYKLDNRGEFTSVFKTLWRDIERHYNSVDVDLGPDTASFNIFYIHSHGGGTGSGTYPLITGMLNTIAGSLESDHVYLAGVGVVPMVAFPEDDSPVTFPGRSIYYPNAHAALKDLEQLELLEFEDNETRELLVQSQTRGASGGGRESVESFTFEQSAPFDDYWLVGVDEGRIEGGLTSNVGPETYRGELNQSIARPLHAITQFDGSAENWTQGRSVIGTVDQSTVSVPHEKVVTYCELKSERANHRERITDEIPDEIEKLEDRKAEIETLKSHLDADKIADETLKEEVVSRLEGEEEFYSGEYIVDQKTSEDIAAVLDRIADDYRIEGEIVATNVLQEKLSEQEAAPQIEEEHKDVIQNLWSKYNMQNEPGGGNVRALAGKASMLDDFLQENIKEYKQTIENWDPPLPGKIQDALPPLIGPFESEREAAEAAIDELQSDYDDLEAIQSEFDRIGRMRQAIEDHRRQIRNKFDDLIDEKNREITELQTERDRLSDEVDRLDTEIETLVGELTDADLGKRVAVLPLVREELEQLDLDAVERLESLSDYVDELVEEEDIRRALSKRYEFAQAKDNRIIDGEMANANYDQYETDSDEMWLLHSEHQGNQDLIDHITIGGAGADGGGKQPGGEIQYLSDPYRIEFVSFSRRGPVSRLKVYQVLDKFAKEGDLSNLAGNYDDWRQAFAYLEWYGRDIEEAFDISAQASVSFPPEMQLTRVEKPMLSEGELKNFVKTNGFDSYLWQGMMWDTYRPGDQRFTGWKEPLRQQSVGFNEFQQATPSPDLKAQWFRDQANWEDIVQAYRDNLIDQTGVELQFDE